MINIIQTSLSEEIKQQIFDGCGEHAIQETGLNGIGEAISFQAHDQNNKFIGAVVVLPFWGQLHIKYVYVEETYRNQSLGTQLMNKAFEYGRSIGCDFAFIETMNFQAPEFYKKLGFQTEFIRKGFANNTSFHYLKKDLINKN